jgi:hypothetical protein
MRRSEKRRQRGLGSRTVGSRRGPIGLQIHHFALRSKAVVAGGLACRFATRKDLGQAAHPIARRGYFGFAYLRRHEIGVRAPQRRTNLPNVFLGSTLAGRDQRGRGTHVETASPGHWKRLREEKHVLGDARHRFAIERHTRIRPPACGKGVGARNIDRSLDRANARALG